MPVATGAVGINAPVALPWAADRAVAVTVSTNAAVTDTFILEMGLSPRMETVRVLDVGVGVADAVSDRWVDAVPVATLTAALDGVGAGADVDGVVTALDLPDGDGVALTRAVRERDPSLPVVVVADTGSEAAASDAIAAGVTDYVPRSADADLGARIAAAVRDAPERATRRPGALRAFPDAWFVVDAAGRVSDARAGHDAAAVLPDDPTAMCGRALADVFPASAAETLDAATTCVLQTGEVRTVEYRLPTSSGDEWVEARVATADGTRAAVAARPITERKRELDELRRKQAHLSQAQEVARIGSWYRHFPSEELWWSDIVYDIFGRSREETPTHETVLSSVHPDDRDHVEDRWNAALAGEPYDIEHRILVDGETRWVRERAELSFSDDGDPVDALGVVHDVTDRKEYERRLETTNERLDVLHRVARHDIRNRMNVVLGCASELRYVLDADPATSRMLDRIEEAARELLEISTQLRDADRVVASDADREPIDVASLARDLAAEFAGEDPTVEWYTAIPDSLPVRATPALAVAIMNVFENAVEHNEGDPRRVAVVVSERDDDRVEVRVVDDGPGLPAVERELLVGDREPTQVAHSSGLGLWITRWIVGNAGGSLDVHDGRNGGTVVTIDLPPETP
ncbi:PAS domain-containing protein [Haloplanus salinarum]|uniref:PAS domain-containing protein n=2 Tax=Haloplanus salinarum TaxID=1912324 RepID=UPI003B428D06